MVQVKSQGMTALRRELAYLAAHEVRIGVLTGSARGGSVDASAPKAGAKQALTVADVFALHELGTRRTPKRSSIVWVMDHKSDDIAKIAERVQALVLDGRMTGETALYFVGEKILSLAKSRIKSKIPPPLSEERLAQKVRAGKSGETPLIHTGQLVNSLRYTVVGSI